MDEKKTPTQLLLEKFQAHLDDILRTRHSYSVLTLDVAELEALIAALTPEEKQ